MMSGLCISAELARASQMNTLFPILTPNGGKSYAMPAGSAGSCRKAFLLYHM